MERAGVTAHAAPPRSRRSPRSTASSARTHPVGERLAVLALVEVRRDDGGDVVVELGAGHLVGAQLAAEVGAQAGGAAEVHLEALDLVAVVVEHQLALEADVGDLGAGAGVGAAVDVDGDRGVEVGEAALELGDQVAGAVLGVDDGELAELDAGAGHGVRRHCDGRADRPISSRRRSSGSTASGWTPISTIFWYGVRRAPRTAYCVHQRRPGRAARCRRRGRRSARRRRRSRRPSARARRRGRGGRPATAGTGVRSSWRPRYSFSSTSRNLSTPQSATRNFSRARERSRR